MITMMTCHKMTVTMDSTGHGRQQLGGTSGCILWELGPPTFFAIRFFFNIVCNTYDILILQENMKLTTPETDYVFTKCPIIKVLLVKRVFTKDQFCKVICNGTSELNF